MSKSPQCCPVCEGVVRQISKNDVFCLDCDWDNLTPLGIETQSVAPTVEITPPERRRNYRRIPCDAEWYTKTQLRRYRRWNDDDFTIIAPDWQGGYGYAWCATAYFHKTTVDRHENTEMFQRTMRQREIPSNEKINALAWRVCVQGKELMSNGWTNEMIDRLPIYRNHTWRKRRLFLLDDLKQVSATLRIEKPKTKHKTQKKPARQRERDNRRELKALRDAEIHRLHATGISQREIERQLKEGGYTKVARSTVSRVLKNTNSKTKQKKEMEYV